MPAASPLEAIETGVAAQLALVAGLSASAVTVAPFADAFDIDDDGHATLNNTYLPPAYPGAVLSLNDEDITVETEITVTSPFERKHTFRAPVFVAIYANSDGSVGGTPARFKAWEIAHAAFDRLSSYRPTPADFPSPWQLELDEYLDIGNAVTPLVIDPTTHGMLLRFYARYYITSP